MYCISISYGWGSLSNFVRHGESYRVKPKILLHISDRLHVTVSLTTKHKKDEINVKLKSALK